MKPKQLAISVFMDVFQGQQIKEFCGQTWEYYKHIQAACSRLYDSFNQQTSNPIALWKGFKNTPWQKHYLHRETNVVEEGTELESGKIKLSKGFKQQTWIIKYSLCADDVLLALQNPQFSPFETITLIDGFSSISDYSINWAKSTVLSISFNFQRTPSMPLQLGNIWYLGTCYLKI